MLNYTKSIILIYLWLPEKSEIIKEILVNVSI
jgi:hypothetical protein